MKKLIVLVFITTAGFSQEIDSIKTAYPNIEPVVVIADSLSASDIYNRAKEFINISFNNPEDVIKGDNENKSIMFNAATTVVYKSPMGKKGIPFEYHFGIQFKEGRYRVTISALKMQINSSNHYLEYFYKRNGDLRKNKEIATMRTVVFNGLNDMHFALYNYIVNYDKVNDW